MADTLIDKLKAALDADEQLAREASAGPWRLLDEDRYPMSVWAGDRPIATFVRLGSDAEHAIRHDPARVLRQVAAHRKILDKHAEALAKYPAPPGRAAELVAEIYAYWTAVRFVAEAYGIELSSDVR